MAYVVVEFDEQNRDGRTLVAVVHHSWLTPLKRRAFWPQHKDQKRFDRALRLGEPVDKSSWELSNVLRTFYATDDFAKARKKVKEAEVTSNLESEAENLDSGRVKRKLVRTRKLCDTSEDEDDELPRPPAVKRTNLSSNVFLQCHSQSDTGCTNSSETNPVLNESSQSLFNQNISNSTCSVTRNAGNSILNESSQLFTISNTPTSSLVTKNFGNGTSSGNIRTANCYSRSPRDNLNVTDKLVALVSHVKEQNDQILAWISKQNNAVTNTTFGMPDIPFVFPLQTVEELDELNVYINNNNEHFIALTSYLGTLGGNSVTTKTNRIFKHLVADTVVAKFNYYGQRSQKRAFSDLLLKNLIVGAVKKSIPNTTDKEVEDVIKVWLKHAQERLKKARHVRKN